MGDKIFYDLDTMMTNENQLQSGVIKEFVCAITAGDTSVDAGEYEVNAIRAIEAAFEASSKDKTIKLTTVPVL